MVIKKVVNYLMGRLFAVGSVLGSRVIATKSETLVENTPDQGCAGSRPEGKAPLATPWRSSIFPAVTREMVGARGFEPPTTWPPARCATGLRHAPVFL
jgi:hypothetical protein